jgi:hypothetical protein
VSFLLDAIRPCVGGKDGEAFEVEFLTLSGRTVAVSTVEAAQLRPVSDHEVSHARELGPT